MTDQPDTGTAAALGVATASAMMCSAAIVAALAQSGAVDPLMVAAWAETFATGQSAALAPELRDGVVGQLRGFAGLLRAMATVPAGAGRA